MVLLGKLIDLTGRKFGRWTVIERGSNIIKNTGGIVVTWWCRCECGTVREVVAPNLRNGISKSCGCLKREILGKLASERSKKYNEYDLSGDYGIGYLKNGDLFIFDKEDYDKIKSFYWIKNNNGYVSATDRIGKTGKHTILLHRLIMDVYDKTKTIDHINHDKLNNTKDNLRIATYSQNLMNRNVKNKLGHRGIGLKKDGKYYSNIVVKDKRIHLGTFLTIEEAIRARLNAEDTYFGEFAYNGNEVKNDQQRKIK